MTIEEAKKLEERIGNDILNNIPFSHVYHLITEEAKTRAKAFVSDATEEQLLEVKKKIDEAEALQAKEEAEAKKSAKVD
jgi:hypothetical protein